jgi:hypothetical protein
MWHYPRDVTSLSCFGQHNGQSLRHEVKEQRREGIPLPQTPLIAEKGSSLSVDGDGSLATSNKLQNAVYRTAIKALSPQNLSQEIPIDSIVSLFEVQLKQNAT